MKGLKYIILLLVVVTLSSCGASKKVLASGKVSKAVTVKQLVKTVKQNEADFKTLSGRLKIELTQDGRTQSYGVSFRMKKDNAIWLSKFGFVKALITPSSVAFYNKLDNSYFEGDFEYLSKILGTEIDFDKLQNILLGHAINPLNAKEYDVSLDENSYVLSPKVQQAAMELFVLINPAHYRVSSQEIAQQSKGRILQISYDSYQEVDKVVFPEKLSLVAVDNNKEIVLGFEFKNLKFNEKLSFPFKIPKGYTKIEF